MNGKRPATVGNIDYVTPPTLLLLAASARERTDRFENLPGICSFVIRSVERIASRDSSRALFLN